MFYLIFHIFNLSSTVVKLDIFSFKKAILFLCCKSVTSLPMRSVKSFTNGSKREKSFFRLYTFGFRSFAKVTVFRTFALSLSKLKTYRCACWNHPSSESIFLTELILCELSDAVFRSIAVSVNATWKRRSPMFLTVFFSTFSILFSSSLYRICQHVTSVTKPDIRRMSVLIVVILRPTSFAMEAVLWSTFATSWETVVRLLFSISCFSLILLTRLHFINFFL